MTGLRSETSSTYVNPNGTLTVDADALPRFVQRAGSWTPVDTTLSVSGGRVAPAAVTGNPSFSDGGTGALVTATVAGSAYSLTYAGTLPVPTLSGSTATYANVQPGVDLVVTATPVGYEQSFVLHQKPTAAFALQLHLHSDGLLAATDGHGGVNLLDPHGRVVASSPAGVVDDSSSGQGGVPGHTSPLPVNGSLGATPSHDAMLAIAPSASWLASASTVYPVTVDPVGNFTETAWSQYRSVSGTIYNGTGSALTGYANSEINRPAWVYNWTPVGGSAQVTDADFTNRVLTAPGVTATVYTENLSGTNVNTTWSGQPSGTQIASLVINSTGYGKIFNLTSFVQANGINQNSSSIALMLESKDEVNNNHSIVWANNPTLQITYDHTPNTPTALTTSPSQGSNTNSNTPTFKAAVSDPDNESNTATFTIKQGSTVVASGTGTAQSGGTASWTDTTALTNGSSYTLSVTSADSSGLVSPAATTTFNVDTTAPSAPGVSCNISNGAWATTSPQSCTYTSSATDLATFTRSLDNGTPVTLTPTSGSVADALGSLANGLHTLTVNAVDTAGNISSTTNYSFGVGTGGVTTPAAGQTTQQYVTLGSTLNPSAANSVTFLYRQGATGTFTTIPTGDVTLSGGGNPTWPVSVSGSTSTPMTWNATSSLGGTSSPDGEVDVEACFYNGGTAAGCSTPNAVQYLRHAFGQSYATTTMGPVNVSLLTGDSSYSTSDVTVPTYTGSLSVGRSITSLSPRSSADPATTPENSVFGPGWTASLPGPSAGEADDKITDNAGTTGTGTIMLTAPDSSVQVFHNSTGSTGDGTYLPVGDLASTAASLSRTTVGGTVTIVRTDEGGTTTTWTGTSGGSYTTTSVVQPSTSGGTTDSSQFGYDGTSRLSRVIAPIPTGVATTGSSGCSLTTALSSLPNGCRALSFTYDGTSGLLTSVQYTAENPQTSTMVTDTEADYSYDTYGRLAAEWDPRITPSLQTAYAYTDTGTTAPRLASITPPGQATWTLGYDTSSPPRLQTVSRLQPGGATATQTVVYGVPLTGTSAPTAMDSTTVGAWGETQDPPVTGAAVFRADHTPTLTGGLPASGDWPYASLTYLDVDGRSVNTAAYGAGAWQISTSQYDSYGNQVFTLDPRGHNEALAPDANTNPAVAALSSSAQRAQLLATVNVYNTDITAGPGTELVDSYGPTHTVTQNNTNAAVSGRLHAHTVYDQGSPGGAVFYLPTTATTSLCVVSGTGCTDSTNASDVRVVTTGYDATLPGSASGWTLGEATHVTTKVDSNSAHDVTTSTGYNAVGQVVEGRLPDAAQTGTDTSGDTTKTTYYTADTSSGITACNNHPETAGLICQTAPAGQPSGVDANHPSITSTTYTYNRMQQQVTKVETETTGSATVSRTTTSAYDSDYRKSSQGIATVGDSSTAVNAQYIGYDSSTGMQNCLSTSASCAGTTTSQTYDSNGRVSTSTDADGNVATTTYDIVGRVASVVGIKSGTTFTNISYTYDGTAGEHRGLPTSENTNLGGSNPSTFSGIYDADGNLTSETYANGTIRADSYDEAGNLIGRTYTFSGSSVWVFTQIPNVFAEVSAWSNPNRNGTNQYDRDARLSNVLDTNSTTSNTITRQYALDGNSNRTAVSLANPYDQAVNASTPSAYWRLNETSGTTAADASANGNSGTYTGSGYTQGVTGATPGDTNAAVSFNATNGRITAPAASWNKNNGNFTDEFWFTPPSNASSSPAFMGQGRDAGSTNGWEIDYASGGHLMYNAGNATVSVDSGPTSAATSGWHLADVTYDGTNLKIYVDGQLATSQAVTLGTNAASDNFNIGSSGNASGTYLNGSLDDVALYASPLSATSVANHYEDAQAGSAVQSNTYDNGDRLTSTGYTYDGLGRTSSLPASAAGGTNMTLSYFSNDLVQQESQGTATETYTLDPLYRTRTAVSNTSGLTSTYHYDNVSSAGSDSPSWIANSDGSWSRNVEGLDGQLSAVLSSSGVATIEVLNPHGDIVGTEADTSGSSPLGYSDTSEFGVPRSTASTGRYGWLGGYLRSGDSLGGLLLMGQRLYDPAIGRFLQTDPIPGASCNSYDYVCQSPGNSTDLTGRSPEDSICNNSGCFTAQLRPGGGGRWYVEFRITNSSFGIYSYDFEVNGYDASGSWRKSIYGGARGRHTIVKTYYVRTRNLREVFISANAYAYGLWPWDVSWSTRSLIVTNYY